MKPRSVDDVEDKRSDAIADRIDALALLPPPPAPRPVRLRPARGRIVPTSVNGVALV
jgi:hypothetical protein